MYKSLWEQRAHKTGSNRPNCLLQYIVHVYIKRTYRVLKAYIRVIDINASLTIKLLLKKQKKTFIEFKKHLVAWPTQGLKQPKVKQYCLFVCLFVCLFRLYLTREFIWHKSIFHKALKDGIIAIFTKKIIISTWMGHNKYKTNIAL